MNPLDPRTLKDARINAVFVESDARLLLHLRDGRAVAISATLGDDGVGGMEPTLLVQHTNPGGAA